MLFSKTLVKGYVMKKVENIKMGRLQNPFHKRKLTLNLQCNPAPSLVMESVDSQDGNKRRDIPLNLIEAVYIKNLRLIRKNTSIEQQTRKRSTSALKRVFTKISDQVAVKDEDPYDFAFEI